MDPALPPGGLQQIMAQYDQIRSHATEGPPWEPEEDQDESGVTSNATPQEAGGTPGEGPDITTFGQPSQKKTRGFFC